MQQNATFAEKKMHKFLQKIKSVKKLKIISIMHVNTEAEHIAFVI